MARGRILPVHEQIAKAMRAEMEALIQEYLPDIGEVASDDLDDGRVRVKFDGDDEANEVGFAANRGVTYKRGQRVTVFRTKSGERFIAGHVGSNQGRAVEEGQLAQDSVTGFQLKSGEIATRHLGAGAVDQEKIAAGAVTGGKIADGTIGFAKLSEGFKLPGSQVSGAIAASQISGTLAGGNIPDLGAGKITTGTLGKERLPSGVAFTSDIPKTLGAIATDAQVKTAAGISGTNGLEARIKKLENKVFGS